MRDKEYSTSTRHRALPVATCPLAAAPPPRGWLSSAPAPPTSPARRSRAGGFQVPCAPSPLLAGRSGARAPRSSPAATATPCGGTQKKGSRRRCRGFPCCCTAGGSQEPVLRVYGRHVISLLVSFRWSSCRRCKLSSRSSHPAAACPLRRRLSSKCR